MAKAKSKRPSVWEKPPDYGTYTGPRGNPDQWRENFKSVMGNASLDDVKLINSPYETLGVQITDSWETVQSAFRKLMLIHHPDKGGDKDKCIQILKAFDDIKRLQTRG